VFNLVAARTGLREHEAVRAGYTPLTSQASPDDHKAYYPGAQTINIRITGDADTGKLLGAQLIGPTGTETAKRVDTYATALFHNMTRRRHVRTRLVLHTTAGLAVGCVQMAAQAWVRDHQLPAERAALRPTGVS
jgi:NADPH-dependent 2,4-dienoyl-CoA reductase/sulfur reductase-like enzyme